MDMIRFDRDTTSHVFRFSKVAAVAIFASTAQTHAAPALRDNKLPKFDSTQTTDFSPWFNALAVPTIGPDHIAIRRIRDLKVYSNGWNGPGSVSASPEAIDDAEVFARKLFAACAVDPPHITLTSDGEVNFYWRSQKGTVDLGFFGTSTYSYFVKPANGEPSYADAVNSSELAHEVIAVIGVTAEAR